MSHGTVVLDYPNSHDQDQFEVLDAGGSNGPDMVLKTECIEACRKAELGEVVTFDALELDNLSHVTVFDHKGDETTAQALARRLAADSELPDE